MIAAAFEEIGHGPVGRAKITFVGVVEGVNGNETVVDDEAIEVTIHIVIEECGVGGIAAFIGQSVFRCFICERKVVVIDEELTLWFLSVDITGIADEDIKPAIVVHIGHDHTGAPIVLGTETRFGGNVFELPVAFIEEEFIWAHVGGEEYIGPAVIIDITDGGTAAVVKVAVAEDVEVGTVMDIVAELNAGLLHLREERFRFFTGPASCEATNKQAEYGDREGSHHVSE